MHTNLCILIEISVEIGMTQKTGIYWSCITNCEFHFRNFTKIDRIFLKLQWKLSENCQFAVFRLGPWLPRSWEQIWIMPPRKTYPGQDFSYSGAPEQSNQNSLPEDGVSFAKFHFFPLFKMNKLPFDERIIKWVDICCNKRTSSIDSKSDLQWGGK